MTPSARVPQYALLRWGFVLTAVVLLKVPTLRGEVGYAMRGSPQPFHNWDSQFNSSGSREYADAGFVLRRGACRLRPHIAAWAGQSDNVYLDADREAAVEDSFTTLAPGLMFVYGSEESDYISLNYTFEKTRYSNEEALDSEGHLFSAGLHFQPGKFVFHLSDQYSDTTDTNPELAQRTSKLLNIESLRVSRDVSRKTSFEIEQSYEIHNYQANDLIDFDDMALGLRGYHQTFAKVRTSVDAFGGRVDMHDPEVLGDADYMEVGVGLQGRLTAKSALHARGAWHRRQFDDGIKSIDTWSSTVGLSSRLSSRMDWGVDVSRRLTPSSQVEGVTRETTALIPSVRYTIWRDRLACAVRGAFEWSEYYGPTGVLDREDDYWYVTGSLDWHVKRPVTVGVSAMHAEQDSTSRSAVYEQNNVLVRCMVNY
jgi:hypothetical protein